MQMQVFLKKALSDMEAIHGLATEQLEKLHLLVMPGTTNAIRKIAFLAGPYCEGAPGPDGVQVKETKVGEGAATSFIVNEKFMVKEEGDGNHNKT
jgi:hypothetical protein